MLSHFRSSTKSLTWDAVEGRKRIRTSTNLVQEQIRYQYQSHNNRSKKENSINDSNADIRRLQFTTNCPENIIRHSLYSFNEFDTNGNGEIDENELGDALSAMGIHSTPAQIAMAMTAINNESTTQQTKKNTIDFEMYVKMVKQMSEMSAVCDDDEQHARNILSAFVSLGGKADKSGSVSSKKLKAVLDMFGIEMNVKQLMNSLDTDHNGRVDFKEFSEMFKNEKSANQMSNKLCNIVNGKYM